jgi:site-specific DNA-cytosine methylase
MRKTDIPPSSQPAHAVFSFFSGAGFLDLGFKKSGFEIAFANELNAVFVQGYGNSRALGVTRPHSRNSNPQSLIHNEYQNCTN